MDFGAVLVATCVSTAIATALMTFLANYPIAVAPAMRFAVSARPKTAIRTGRLCRSPSVTSVPGDPTINPAHSKPNRRDQQTDARGDRVLDRRGDRRDQLLSQADARGQDEQRPGDRHGAERDRPGHLHAENHGVGKEEVVAHRRATCTRCSTCLPRCSSRATPSSGDWGSMKML